MPDTKKDQISWHDYRSNVNSWLQPLRLSNQGGSKEHIALITNSFF